MKTTIAFRGGAAAIDDQAMQGQRGLREEFAKLLATHGPALRRLAASYARSANDREDLLQDIAIALWMALPKFRRECSERTFLFRIAHNRGISYFSKQRPIVPMSTEDLEANSEYVTDSPESSLSQEQQEHRLQHAVHSLPIIYRQVIILSLEGLEYKEIAQVLGITENNVGVRANRGRQLLRDLMRDPK